MNTFSRTTLASTLTLLATSLLTSVSATSLPPAAIAPVFNASLIRCADSHFSKSLGTCGGDALAQGRIALTPKATLIKTEGALADPFNLYEVYWLALGDTLADAVPAGNFVTDCKGNARGSLTTLTTANEALNPTATTPVILYPTAGYLSAGVFLVYSRGPWAQDNDGDCVADTYNTVVNGADTDASHALANPPVILGVDNVQFLSGYQFSVATPGSEAADTSAEAAVPVQSNAPTVPVTPAAMGTGQQAPMNNMSGNFGQPPRGNGQQAPMNNMSGNFGQPPRGNGQQAPMNNMSGNFGQPPRGNGQQAPMNNMSGNFGQSGHGNGQQAPMNNAPGNFGQSGQGNGQQPPMNNTPGNFGQSGQGNGQVPVAPATENPDAQQSPVQVESETANGLPS